MLLRGLHLHNLRLLLATSYFILLNNLVRESNRLKRLLLLLLIIIIHDCDHFRLVGVVRVRGDAVRVVPSCSIAIAQDILRHTMVPLAINALLKHASAAFTALLGPLRRWLDFADCGSVVHLGKDGTVFICMDLLYGCCHVYGRGGCKWWH